MNERNELKEQLKEYLENIYKIVIENDYSVEKSVKVAESLDYCLRRLENIITNNKKKEDQKTKDKLLSKFNRTVYDSLTKGEQSLDFKIIDEEEMNPDVFYLKLKTGELIDFLEETKDSINNDRLFNKEKEDDELRNSQALRAISVAQTEYETACMWAVKSIFKKQ